MRSSDLDAGSARRGPKSPEILIHFSFVLVGCAAIRDRSEAAIYNLSESILIVLGYMRSYMMIIYRSSYTILYDRSI